MCLWLTGTNRSAFVCAGLEAGIGGEQGTLILLFRSFISRRTLFAFVNMRHTCPLMSPLVANARYRLKLVQYFDVDRLKCHFIFSAFRRESTGKEMNISGALKTW